MVKSLRHRRGFALIDAIVAGIIVGAALSALLSLAGQAISSQIRGEAIETAARLADERLNLVLAVGPEAYPSVFETAGVCDAPFEEFGYRVDITPNGAGEAYSVRATINWAAGGRGKSTTLSLETRIAPRLGDDPDPERRPDLTVDRNAGA